MTSLIREKPIPFSGPMVRAILDRAKTQTRRVAKPQHAPYSVGDRLWVREKQRVIARANGGTKIQVCYEADGAESDWLPYPSRLKGFPHVGKCLAYGGYKESARLWLRVTGVRAERLQEISEDDAVAEGCVAKPSECEPCAMGICSAHQPPIGQFIGLWDSINGKKPERSWADNPWVWVYDFRVAEGGHECG